MSNSFRIRTQVGVDKSIKVNLTQDFEFLEILSLKLLQNEIYTRQCADYGVVIGRISINNGFGLPNCRVSIFIPLSNEDATNPIISDLYPYKSLSDTNDDGYRYNLLPYTKSYSAHVPTGTFFDKEDVLINQSYIEVFDKYYRYTAITNDSGDFMIFGVPLGVQTIHVDVDLSDIGEFSLAPQDLIRTGLATESQVAGTRFKASNNLNELPQIISINRIINVEPLWGQPEICEIGINRTDFDLSAEANVTIEPTAIFMGSIFSDTDNLALKRNCKPKVAQGELCSLVAGPGEILAIRQTIDNDTQGRPILEQFELESGGQVIDENGTWLLDLPMNLDYVTTNEFGERVISNDPEVGIPTRGKYRFKIKWNQSPKLDENVKRGYFLVPNVREYGWTNSNLDPLINNLASLSDKELAEKSYAFSLDWNDYADPNTAIRCEDTFYQFSYNKVYTVSQLIDQYRKGTIANKIISVKNILDNSCESENNKFPTNDASFRWDFIFLLYTLASYVFRPILIALVFVIHVLYLVIILLKILLPLLATYFAGLSIINFVQAGLSFPALGLILGFVGLGVLWGALSVATFALWAELLRLELKGINLPLLLYDQCEFCPCSDSDSVKDEGQIEGGGTISGALIPQPALPNSSGVQILNLEGGVFNSDLLVDLPYYLAINKLLSGVFVQYDPYPLYCPSKVPMRSQYPLYKITQDDVTRCPDFSSNINEEYKTDFFTFSLTLAERINLFNTKAKYFNESGNNNPGGGVNRIKIIINPTANNPNNSINSPHHYDNVICMLMTSDSLSNLQTGTMITFVDPNKTKDINYTGATLNEFGNNAITGTSVNTAPFQITIEYAKPDNSGNQLVQYLVPTPSSADTNFHKFPTDIEYFQVITAMTYGQYSSLTSNQQPNGLHSRFLNQNMLMNYLIDGRNFNDVIYEHNPLESLEDYENQTIVFLSRGVDPYSTRVMTQYGLGILFGYTNEDDVIVTGMTKLNVPIQGNFLNVSHNRGYYNNFDAQSTDNYSGSKLYYSNFNYIPQNQSGYTTDNLSYYSIVSNEYVDPNPSCTSTIDCAWANSQGISDFNYGFRVSEIATLPQNSNYFIRQFSRNFTIFKCEKTYYFNNPNTPGLNKGYFPGEIVEGASYMGIQPSVQNYNFPTIVGQVLGGNTSAYSNNTGPNNWTVGFYMGKSYTTIYPSNNFLINPNRLTVLRSDRLPTSDRELRNCTNSFSLQQNQNLGIYVIPDDGALGVVSNTGGNSIQVQENDDDPPRNFTAELLATTNSCENSRNLECYSFTANTTLRDGITEPGGGRYGLKDVSCQKFNNKFIFEKGCYKLVTTVLGSLFKDVALVTEWLSRTNVTFGACRNIFSHLFTHNWVNGSLYAFAFKNNRVLGINGELTSEICSDVVFFDQDTNNFFYRSSPYTTGGTDGFIGKVAPTTPNRNNLLFPTTIMDLGPRNDYLQELVYSDEYDGYVVNQLRSTSYQDVSELLNLLIISRLANTSLISILIGANGGSIFEYFERPRITVDADYAQAISVNSELGVVPFEAESYPNIDLTDFYTTPPPNAFAIDPVYFNTGEFRNVIFGIFYSSDTQVRDFITPKRTIINGQVQANNNCAFNNFYCYSQEVPFYQWEIKSNSNVDSIFGSQKNNWYTNTVQNNRFLKSKYQSMDRADLLSRYFRTNNASSLFVEDDKGYIFSRNTETWTPVFTPTDSIFWTRNSYNPLVNGQDSYNNPDPRIITVGAPFYFYFGLKKGKSAWDRFAKKWINFENIN